MAHFFRGRTYLASQRLPSSLLVLILTLVTIPSTISESIFTELKDQNLCRDDSGKDDWEDVFSEDVRDVTACKGLCEEHNSKCVAITYWNTRKGWDEGGGWYGCSLHSRLCHDPRGKHRNGRDVFRRTCDVTFWESKDDSSAGNGIYELWRSNEEYPGYADTFEQLCQANCILLKDMNSSKWKQDYTEMRQKLKNGQDLSSIVKYKGPAYDGCSDTTANDDEKPAGFPTTEVVVIVVVFIVLILIAIPVAMVMKKKKKDPEERADNADVVPVDATNAKAKSLMVASDKAFNIPLSQLTIGKTIGQGGQGQIYRGEFSGVAVAIKEIMSVMFDPTQTKALKEEASMLSSIHHPNIVQFYGMSIDDSSERGARYYLVTDLKDTDLRKLVDAEKQPSRSEVMRMAMEICGPLEYLHSINMVHRDLKPENVLVGGSNRTLFLCDFGLTKEYGQNTNVDMTTNTGTVAYMAPELSNAKNYAVDFSRSPKELDLAEQVGDEALVAHHAEAVHKLNLENADPASGKAKEQMLASFAAPKPPETENRPSKVRAKTKEVYKLDCYSFAMMLWVLLEWGLPFRYTPPMQILVAVGYLNQRPSTKRIVAAGWPDPVIGLMRRLWAASPADRPSIKEARELLSQHRE